MEQIENKKEKISNGLKTPTIVQFRLALSTSWATRENVLEPTYQFACDAHGCELPPNTLCQSFHRPDRDSLYPTLDTISLLLPPKHEQY